MVKLLAKDFSHMHILFQASLTFQMTNVDFLSSGFVFLLQQFHIARVMQSIKLKNIV